MDNLDKLSSAEISIIIDEREKELSKALQDHTVVEQEKLNLQRRILELQIEKKDKEISLSKSMNHLKQLGITIKLLKSKFWAVKNSGT